MVIDNIKIVNYNFSIRETHILKKYLEDMVLEGWELKDATSGELIFEKTKKKNIKYAIEILDKIRYIDQGDGNNILEYEEICSMSGWDIVKRVGNMIILKSYKENPEEIHTDERAKFHMLKKVYKKESIGIFLICTMWFYPIIFSFDTIFKGRGGIAIISNNGYIILSILCVIGLILEMINIIYLSKWIKDSEKNLNIGEPVNYKKAKLISFYKLLGSPKKFEILQDNITLQFFFLAIFIIVALLGLNNYLFLLACILVVPGYFIIKSIVNMWKVVKKNNLKSHKAIFRTLILIAPMLFVFNFRHGFDVITESKLDSLENRITIEAFNEVEREYDKDGNKVIKNIFNIYSKGLLATHYGERIVGEELNLIYEVFESENKEIVDYYHKGIIEEGRLNLIEEKLDYSLIESNLPEDIEVYKLEEESEENIKRKIEEYKSFGEEFEYSDRRVYLISNDKKFVQVSIAGTDKSEDEVLEIIYNQIFE